MANKTITLIPTVRTFTGGTETFADGTPREPQEFWMIWPEGVGVVGTATETVRRTSFILVGNYDAEIAVGDHWEAENQKHVIEYLYPFNGYEVKAGGVSIEEMPNA